MASRRAPGSISETPGLDFGRSWDEFFEILGFLAGKMQELISNFKLKLRGSSWELQLPVHLTPTSNFNHDFPKGGWAAVPPLGVFDPPPTEGAHGVLDHHHQLPHQTPDTNIEWPCCKCLMRFSCFPSL